MTRMVIVAIVLAIAPRTAAAAPCPGNPDALGTERVLEADAKSTPRVGRKQFPSTLPLRAKELVLTFDDGPWPGTTPRILDALKNECVRATFFLLGGNTAAHPQLARRALTEGHSIGHHTYSHPLLDHMPLAKAEAEIDQGIAADESALHGRARTTPTTPFFRFPGFASNSALLDRMSERGLLVFGADVWASDWEQMGPELQLGLILSRIEKVGRGIVLFHDTKAQTSQMLPAFLRELKRRGYQIVHIVSSGGNTRRDVAHLPHSLKIIGKQGRVGFRIRNPPLRSPAILSGSRQFKSVWR
ncbi:MAG: polysaccharide deacetylase family protein [Pseudolabrys sp.]